LTPQRSLAMVRSPLPGNVAANFWDLNESMGGAGGDLSERAYDPGSNCHTYCLEFRGDSISMIDGCTRCKLTFLVRD
jgi:hypothetical protein